MSTCILKLYHNVVFVSTVFEYASQIKCVCIFLKIVNASFMFLPSLFICTHWSYLLIGFPLAKYCALIKTRSSKDFIKITPTIFELDIMRNIPVPDVALDDQYDY